LADLVERDELDAWAEWVREGAFPLDVVPDRIMAAVELRLADIERADLVREAS
jgi:hypothetical protein